MTSQCIFFMFCFWRQLFFVFSMYYFIKCGFRSTISTYNFTWTSLCTYTYSYKYSIVERDRESAYCSAEKYVQVQIFEIAYSSLDKNRYLINYYFSIPNSTLVCSCEKTKKNRLDYEWCWILLSCCCTCSEWFYGDFRAAVFTC